MHSHEGHNSQFELYSLWYPQPVKTTEGISYGRRFADDRSVEPSHSEPTEVGASGRQEGRLACHSHSPELERTSVTTEECPMAQNSGCGIADVK